ncbi:MAG: GH39 family glycosyl hydrolase [Myxococcota bacterium]
MAHVVRLAFALLSFALCLSGCETRAARAPGADAATSLRTVAIGLCEDYPEESRSLAEVRRDFAVLKAAGLDLLRVSIGWDEVEPQKDRYDFAFWDQFVDIAVKEHKIRLLPYVAYTPRWNSDGAPEDFWKTPPRDAREFGELMRLLSERYRGRVHSWELWNEPDNRDYWLGSSAEYATLLEVGSLGVRSGDAGAQVVFGGLAGGVEFLRQLFDEHRAAERVDVVNLHSYYETWNENPVETIPEYVDEVTAIVKRHGGRQTLWMAEFGYSDFLPDNQRKAHFGYEHSLEFQAVMLVRALALALSKPELSLLAWYELKDARASDAVIGDAHNRHLGVTFADYRPKPAFDALVFMNRLVAPGFRSVDSELTVAAKANSALVWRAFLSARRSVVFTAWLQTHPKPAAAGHGSEPNDARRERVRVRLPYKARGPARAYDARGRPRDASVSLRRFGHATELSFELAAGDVSVVELPVKLPE